MRWCRAPNCSNATKAEYFDAKPVECLCGHVFCFGCGELWHDPVNCKWLKNWIKKCKDNGIKFEEPNEDVKTCLWLAENTKKCPKCFVIIEKNGGCNHIICKNQACRSEFCWECLGAWESHKSSWFYCPKKASDAQERLRKSQYTHFLNGYKFFKDDTTKEQSILFDTYSRYLSMSPNNFYKENKIILDHLSPYSLHHINLYNEDDAKKYRDAQKSLIQSKQRFSHYCNSYMNHYRNLLVERKLIETIVYKMDDMLQHISWQEAKILRDAVHILCECRQTLMFTYVFGFYSTKNNHSIIFERNQSDLEIYVEKLSGYFSAYLNGVITSYNTVDILKKVQDKYRYCEHRRKVLLDHVHEGYENDYWEYQEDLINNHK